LILASLGSLISNTESVNFAALIFEYFASV
jgi:hypothetical protein